MTSRLAGLVFAIQKGSVKHNFSVCVNAPLEMMNTKTDDIATPPLSKFSVPIWHFQGLEIKVW